MSRTPERRGERRYLLHGAPEELSSWGFVRDEWQSEADWFDWSPVADRFGTEDNDDPRQSPTTHFRWGGGRASRGRELGDVQLFLVHAVGSGNNAGQTACNTFMGGTRQASAHFVIDRSGAIFQLVKEKHIALHTSDWVDDHSVGVEHCNATGSGAGDEDEDGESSSFVNEAFGLPLVRASLRLARWTFRRWKVDAGYPGDPFRRLPDRARRTTLHSFHGVAGHRHVHTGGSKPCPTLNFPWRHYVMELQGNAYTPLSSADEPTPLADADVAHCRGLEARSGGVFHAFRHDIHLELHSGIHLAGAAIGAPVRCPFYGKIIAARSYRPSGAPDDWRASDATTDWDRSFVLLRHELTVGDDHLVFYSLLANLMDIAARARPFTPPGGSTITSTNTAIPWFDELYHMEHGRGRTTALTEPWLRGETNDVITFSDDDALAVFPGEVIGHAGILPWARGRARLAGLHFEVFADPADIAPLVAAGHLLESFALAPPYDCSADANPTVSTRRSPGVSYLNQLLDASAVWEGNADAILAGRGALSSLRDPPRSFETWTPPSDLERTIFRFPSQWSSAYPANPAYTGREAEHREAEQWLDQVAAVAGLTQIATLHPVAFHREVMTRYQQWFDEQNPDILLLPAPGATHSLSRAESNRLLGPNSG